MTETAPKKLLIAVPRERTPGERRVAATPDSVRKLVKLGFEVAVEAGAGAAANFRDADYAAAGARLVTDPRAIWREADLVVKLQPPTDAPDLGAHEADLLREGATLVGFVWPARNKELLDKLAARRATVLAMD